MHCHHAAAPLMIPSAVFMASLLGSGHCALMCGGLVAAAARSRTQQLFYHAGRLSGYMALGAVSGWVGANAVTRLPSGFSEGIAWLVALSFVALGVLGWKGGSWHIKVPGADKISQWTVSAFRHLTDPSKPQRNAYAGLIGLLSIFLPCGWLYSFVLASLTMASPLKGAAIMAVFWMGTLPALAAAPWFLKRVFSLADGITPKISSALLIAAGVLPILFRYLKLT